MYGEWDEVLFTIFDCFILVSISSDIPYFIYDIEALEARKASELPQKCPKFVVLDQSKDEVDIKGAANNDEAIRGHIPIQDDKVFNHQPFFRMLANHATFLVWVEEPSMERVLKNIFDWTVMVCQQYRNPGVFHPQNRFLFVIDPETQNASNIQNIFRFVFFLPIKSSYVLQPSAILQDAC